VATFNVTVHPCHLINLLLCPLNKPLLMFLLFLPYPLPLENNLIKVHYSLASSPYFPLSHISSLIFFILLFLFFLSSMSLSTPPHFTLWISLC
jgi:hypothetical protein